MELTAKQIKDNAEILGVEKKRLEKQVGNLNNLVSRLKADLVAKGEGNTNLRDTVYITAGS
jgi:uncharacterized small protein (DUF1192 family)